MSMFLAGIGTAVPTYRINQPDAAEIVKEFCCETPEQERLLSALYRRSGVQTRGSVLLHASDGPPPERQSFFGPRAGRHGRGPTTGERMVCYEASASTLAVAASRKALGASGVAASEITHVVTVSCSGFQAPGFDLRLFEELSLRATTSRTHIGFMGCHGVLNALRVARAFCSADPQARILICAVEVCSLHHYCGWDPEKIVANSLFADGAAAVVATAQPISKRDEGWEVAGNGSVVIPETSEAMTWRIRDHGFEMTLSPSVPEIIRSQLRPWLEAWLDHHGSHLEAINSWAVHPGGPRIVQACGRALSLEREQLAPSLSVLAEFGNMSSPTVLFILDRLRNEAARRPCVVLAFGPGLVVEAALLRS